MPDLASTCAADCTITLRIWKLISSDGELAVGADDFGDELAGVGDPHRIGAEGAQAHRAEFGVARHDRVLGAPFLVVEPGGVDEIDLGLEGRLEPVVPVLQRRQDRHVVGFKHVETGAEHIGQLAFVDEDRRLAFAHRQLGAVLDRLAAAVKAPDHRVARVVQPGDDVDEFAFEEIEDHGTPPYGMDQLSPPIRRRARDSTMGRASSGGHAGAQLGAVEHAQHQLVLIGQQGEFLVVVEDRRARARAVVRQAKALGNFLVHAGQAQKVGVFGPDHREGAGVGARIALGQRIDQAIGRARHVGDARHIGRATGSAGRRGSVGPSASRSSSETMWIKKFGVRVVQRDRVAGELRQPGHDSWRSARGRWPAVRAGR